MQEQATTSIAASSLPSSSERSSSSALQIEVKEGTESKGEIREVLGSAAGSDRVELTGEGQGQTSRDSGPTEKESNPLQRLLRNRVSAQQARERKKVYLNDLEHRAKDLEHKNSELQERLSTLHNENQMLRQILKNTTGGGRRGSSIQE